MHCEPRAPSCQPCALKPCVLMSSLQKAASKNVCRKHLTITSALIESSLQVTSMAKNDKPENSMEFWRTQRFLVSSEVVVHTHMKPLETFCFYFYLLLFNNVTWQCHLKSEKQKMNVELWEGRNIDNSIHFVLIYARYFLQPKLFRPV